MQLIAVIRNPDKINFCQIWKIDSSNYEVWVIRHRKNDSITKFKDRPAIVIKKGSPYKPSSEEWGRYGFTYTNLSDSIARATAKMG